MSDSWRLRDAKARFSELVRRARAKPQHITVHGQAALVVLSAATYAALTRRKSLVDHIVEGDPWPDELVTAINNRAQDKDRDIEP